VKKLDGGNDMETQMQREEQDEGFPEDGLLLE
jgi:hypothetical protein